MIATETPVITYAMGTVADVPDLVLIAMLINAETPYHEHVIPDEAVLTDSMRKLVALDNFYVRIGRRESGEACAVIAAYAHINPISGQLCVGEMFWWVAPDLREGLGFASPGLVLLRGLERWAREIGAKWLQLTASTRALEDAYVAMGYVEVETDYQKML